MIEISQKKSVIDSFLADIISSLSAKDGMNVVLCNAMKYVLSGNSKRIRGAILMLISEILNINYEDSIVCAAALELIHNYTLVHDDLPSIDNDEYRRGMLTCHQKFGEGIAILTGNSLFTLALQVLNDGFKHDKEVLFAIMQVLLLSSGCCGVLSGQAQDILMRKDNKILKLNDDQIGETLDMYYLKTGKLFEAVFLISAILAGYSQEKQQLFAECGSVFGVLYQIADDIEDKEVEGEFVHEVKESLIQRFDFCIEALQDERLNVLKDLASKL